MADLLYTLDKRLRDRVESLESELGRGTCENFADYQGRCGEIRALRHVLTELRDLRERHGLD